jgi:hypothetical protein
MPLTGVATTMSAYWRVEIPVAPTFAGVGEVARGIESVGCPDSGGNGRMRTISCGSGRIDLASAPKLRGRRAAVVFRRGRSRWRVGWQPSAFQCLRARLCRRAALSISRIGLSGDLLPALSQLSPPSLVRRRSSREAIGQVVIGAALPTFALTESAGRRCFALTSSPELRNPVVELQRPSDGGGSSAGPKRGSTPSSPFG